MDAVRAAIDEIDAEILRLLAQRQRCVLRAGQLKRGLGDEAVRAPERVRRVLAARREQAARIDLDPDLAERVWRTMIEAFIELEHGVARRPASGADQGEVRIELS
ncbi:MAG: chorismate mutase [Pseudoclavibacter sp.]|nr:chorismate mutase [Pseudoclavibacter sp.]